MGIYAVDPKFDVTEAYVASFMSNVDKTSSLKGCWLWKNPRTDGRFLYGGKLLNPQRISFLIFKGPILPGVRVYRNCGHRACVNPDHLYVNRTADGKLCSNCQTVKALSEFYNFPDRPGFLLAWCIPCQKTINTTREAERIEWNRKKKYGIDDTVYFAMIDIQGNKCRICGQPFEKTGCVEYCRELDRIRGILCFNCLQVVRASGDNIGVLDAAIDYLNKYGAATDYCPYKVMYLISEELRTRMLISQQYMCRICSVDITDRSFTDHNHTTNIIRSLLCPPCNTLLGNAHDKVTVLQSAINYLLRSRES